MVNHKQVLSQTLHQIYSAAGAVLWDLRDYLDEPLAPEDEIDSWPLWVTDDFGGVWCGDRDCPLKAENSEIGNFRGRGFTFAELRQAIGDHIAHRREREADDDQA